MLRETRDYMYKEGVLITDEFVERIKNLLTALRVGDIKTMVVVCCTQDERLYLASSANGSATAELLERALCLPRDEAT
jgi:hypothetical protein